MSLSIQTNVNSMIAQENLRVNSDFQARTIQRLTSGYRINASGDDAAGLAVANQFRSATAELNQGVRNANDGISQLQIIDGGLSNITHILDRLKTLATQSASSTFTGDRATLENEYQALLTEVNRQADNVGLGASNTINAKLVSVYIGGGQDANTNSSVTVDLRGQSVDTVSLGISQTSVLTNAAVQVSNQVASKVVAGDVATFTLQTTSGAHTITINGQAGDTLQGQVNDLNAQLQAYGISASLNLAGKLQFVSANAFSVSGIATGAGGAPNLVDTTAETAVNSGLNRYQFTGQAGGGSHVMITVGGTSAIATLAAPAAPTSVDVDAINAALKAQGITSVSAVLDMTAANTISFQGSANFSISDDHAVSGTYVLDGNSLAATPGGDPYVAINAISASLKSLGITQGKVGTGENALNYAINLAKSQIANFSSAESQIRDADVASEAANLTKAQVLQQSSIAAMAQANSAPQAVLKLLQQ
jgi:flagellin